MTASVQSVLEFTRSAFNVSPNSTGIWGHSMGGFVAIASAYRLRSFAAVCGSQSSVGKRTSTDDEVESWRTSGWAAFPN